MLHNGQSPIQLGLKQEQDSEVIFLRQLTFTGARAERHVSDANTTQTHVWPCGSGVRRLEALKVIDTQHFASNHSLYFVKLSLDVFFVVVVLVSVAQTVNALFLFLLFSQLFPSRHLLLGRAFFRKASRQHLRKDESDSRTTVPTPGTRPGWRGGARPLPSLANEGLIKVSYVPREGRFHMAQVIQKSNVSQRTPRAQQVRFLQGPPPIIN